MEYQSYCDKIQEHFLKSEYISIAQDSFKMLFSPKKAINGMRVFCFIVNGRDAEAELCKKLAEYAVSAAYYDDCEKHLKTAVLPLFIQSEISDKTLSFLKGRAFKEGGAFIIPAAFDLSKDTLICCESFPIIGSAQFKQIFDFANKILHP